MTHEMLEDKHSLGSDEATAALHAVAFSPAEEVEVLQAVDRVFELFEMMFEEQLQYALRADTAEVPTLAEARRTREDGARAA